MIELELSNQNLHILFSHIYSYGYYSLNQYLYVTSMSYCERLGEISTQFTYLSARQKKIHDNSRKAI